MSPPRLGSLLALALLSSACAGPAGAARGNPLPPPAPDRAGTPAKGAAPATGSIAGAALRAPAPLVPARAVPREVTVRRAVETATSLVGAREIVVGGIAYGDGCGALVRAALVEAGAPLPQAAREAGDILALARARGVVRRSRPVAGDLVFLAERPGGPAEHVGLVASVSPAGTALVLHRTERGVARLRVNVARAWTVRGDDGRALNDVLVVGGGKLPAGRLVVGFATLL
jgi:hypothetical protein